MADMFKDMCVSQGYVPPTCVLDGQLCWLLVNSQGNPCKGCNADRNECKGRKKNNQVKLCIYFKNERGEL